jgi:hypothetical protein
MPSMAKFGISEKIPGQERDKDNPIRVRKKTRKKKLDYPKKKIWPGRVYSIGAGYFKWVK